MAHVRALRHDLHRHPELMFQEKRTSECVRRELEELGIEHVSGLAGGTGVLGVIPATSDPGSAPTIALRADMDALPIHEATGAPYASQTPGVMHACGHDGHTAILIGAARVLSRLSERPNNVMLVFQPAEEGGFGGEKMCAEGALSGKVCGRPVDEIYGLHGWPMNELGTVSTRVGPLLAATDEFVLTVTGKGGHAAAPHHAVDPVLASAHIITALQSIVARRVNPMDSVVVTVAAIHAGEANNVIPDSVEMRGTIRALRHETRSLAEREFRRIVTGVASSFGCEAEIQWLAGYPVTVNHEAPVERFRAIARRAIGEARVIDEPFPTMGGEDFAYYGQHVPACFFLLGLKPKGASSYPLVHTPRFDFNDDALPLGVELMARLAATPR
ncbi:MAG TPA: amidohydrolase [Phycisphaerales bacterium]|nr:amidohydrolase [Phycisphaerales bacterium]